MSENSMHNKWQPADEHQHKTSDTQFMRPPCKRLKRIKEFSN